VNFMNTYREKTALYTSCGHPHHQMGRFPCRAVRKRNNYYTVVRLTKENLGEKGKKRIGRGSMARSLLGFSSYSYTEIGKIVWRIPNSSTSYKKHKSTDITPCHFLLELGFRVTDNIRYQSQN